jgi:predicted Rossmann fold flavoprotein
VDTLVKAAQDAGAELICNKEVSEILKNEETRGFNIRCTDGTAYTSSKVIICTGGLSYPKTGSTGDGYRWAESMGHSIRPLFPSLTAMVPEGYKTSESGKEAKGHIDRSTPVSEIGRSLCGNQLKNVGLSLIIDGNEVQNEFGDLDFTDGGIEGPIGFKVSRRCVNAIINGSKVTAVIDLKPAVEYEDLYVRIGTLWNEVSKDKRNANKLYKDRFKLLLPKVLPMSLIPAFTRLNPNIDHKTLAKALKNWKMDIVGYVGYERCVITAGGVSLDEVTAKTLESKLIPGLYFAGEVLDLDADTGGYNLQTAFSTGYLAGISAAR